MKDNKYEYMLVDFSYILTRNLYSISLGKKPGEYDESNLIKSVIQTLSKILRDYKELISADKIILLGDKWSEKYNGYYRTYLIKDYIKYKGDRSYITEDNIDTKELSVEEVEKLKSEAYMNTIKQKAKYIIVDNLRYFGIPSLLVDSWEADDLSYLVSGLLYNPSKKPNIFITKDSDWKYNLSPMMDYFSIPKKGEEPKIITYEEMYNSIPKELVSKGMSLYDYHCYSDALGCGHNNLGISKKKRVNITKTIEQILDNDYSGVENPEMFKVQLETFDITKFPEFESTKNIVLNDFSKIGHLGTIEEFHNFCNKFNISGISDRYYQEFINNFDSNLFKE